jgi:hypothetical protein
MDSAAGILEEPPADRDDPDSRYTRALAARACDHCGKPIGFGRRMWGLGASESEPVYHADCNEKEASR